MSRGKLARSIRQALDACGRRDCHGWQADDLAEAVLVALRRDARAALLDTVRLAEAVQQVLVAAASPAAAAAYASVGGEHRRRRAVLRAAMPSLEHGIPLSVPAEASRGAPRHEKRV